MFISMQKVLTWYYTLFSQHLVSKSKGKDYQSVTYEYETRVVSDKWSFSEMNTIDFSVNNQQFKIYIDLYLSTYYLAYFKEAQSSIQF